MVYKDGILIDRRVNIRVG